jgi:hypothetical protein
LQVCCRVGVGVEGEVSRGPYGKKRKKDVVVVLES